jgi:hypothetical protein
MASILQFAKRRIEPQGIGFGKRSTMKLESLQDLAELRDLYSAENQDSL